MTKPKLSDIKNYKDIKNYLPTLKTEKEEHQQFIEKLKRNQEDIIPFDNCLLAIRLFYKLVNFEELLQKIENEEKKYSLLSVYLLNAGTPIHDNFKAIKAELKTFKDRLTTNILVSDYTDHLAKKVETAFLKFEESKKTVKLNYPVAYAKISAKNQPDQSAGIKKAIALFEDYYKKNSIFFFHMRNHDDAAKAISAELKTIARADKNDSDKIDDALKAILKIRNNMDVTKQIGFNAQKSSFFRRAHFAIELLAKERKTMRIP